jgi:beta-1,3-galactosyltransferase 1
MDSYNILIKKYWLRKQKYMMKNWRSAKASVLVGSLSKIKLASIICGVGLLTLLGVMSIKSLTGPDFRQQIMSLEIPSAVGLKSQEDSHMDVSLLNLEPNPFFKRWRNKLCQSCDMPGTSYLIHNHARCAHKEIFVVFLLNSHPKNSAKRRAIRETWGQRAIMESLNLQYVFILGISDSQETNTRVKAESTKYGDIVQGEFTDTYANLSVKTMVGLNWAQSVCPRAKYIFKTDDDMFINVFAITRTMEEKIIDKNAIYGNCMGSGYPHRCVQSKWYTSYRVYPAFLYGPFCLGSALVMTSEAGRRLFTSSRETPYFQVEDVYVSALARAKAGLNTRTLDGVFMSKISMDDCPKSSKKLAYLLSDVAGFYSLWTQVMSHKCMGK